MTPKIKIWKKWKKHLEILSFYTCVPLIKIICTADVWFLRYEVKQTKLFCHLGQFFAILPFNSMKNQNIKNEKQPWRYQDTIILHKCTKNHDHLICCSWDVVEDGCICYFHFGLYFSLLAPLPPFPPNSSKNENFKSNEKNPWRYHHFTQVYKKIMIICYIAPEKWHMSDVIVIFSFLAIFTLLLP